MVKILTVLNFSAIAAEKLLYSHKDQTWKEFKKRKMVKKKTKMACGAFFPVLNIIVLVIAQEPLKISYDLKKHTK